MPYRKYYFLDTLNIGLLIINSSGEVLFCNNWLKDRVKKGTFVIGEELFYNTKKCFRFSDAIENARRRGIASFLSNRLNHPPFTLMQGSRNLHYNNCVSRLANNQKGGEVDSTILIQFIEATETINEEKYLDVKDIEKLRIETQSKYDEFIDLTSMISNELMSPISILDTNTKLLESILHKKDDWDEEYAEIIKDANSSIDKVKDLMRSAVELSYVPKDEDFKILKIKTILNEVEERNRAYLHKKNITYIYDKYDVVFDTKVQVNTQLLMKLFNYLVENSLEFINKEQLDKWIKIEAKVSGESLLLSITDSGLREDHKLTNDIFKPFVTSKLNGESSGLGLTKSQKIAEAHNGRLQIDQTCLNTRFTLTLPVYHS